MDEILKHLRDNPEMQTLVLRRARELLADLKRNGIKVAIGSASKNARAVLEQLELVDDFDAIADGYAYKHGKPHPDVFVTGGSMVGAEPVECIVVEDAAAGINAALAGGFVTVGMGSYESLKHAHLFVENLLDPLMVVVERGDVGRADELVLSLLRLLGEDLLLALPLLYEVDDGLVNLLGRQHSPDHLEAAGQAGAAPLQL